MNGKGDRSRVGNWAVYRDNYDSLFGGGEVSEDKYERWCAVYLNTQGELEFSSPFRSPLAAKGCTLHNLVGVVRLRMDGGKLASACLDKEAQP